MLHRIILVAGLSLFASQSAQAATFDVTVDATDAIFLAGRTDLAIPPANLSWGDNNPATEDGMRRHSGPTPEEALETLPPNISVTDGDVVRVLDPAIGGINFFNGYGPPFFGPAGNGGLTASNLSSFGSLSGYTGSQGALAGVFLSDAIPTGAPPPATLNAATEIDPFVEIAPLIGQIFYIGTGQTAGGDFRRYVAPTGATRLFFGIPDGFSFVGVPGAYDDNDGAYRIRVGINTIPTLPPVPLPAAGWLMLAGLAGLTVARRKRT